MEIQWIIVVVIIASAVLMCLWKVYLFFKNRKKRDFYCSGCAMNCKGHANKKSCH